MEGWRSDHRDGPMLARRLRRLPEAEVLGLQARVAQSPRARLLGLAGLEFTRAGAALLIPRCRSVHTFGMRFALDIVFLDRGGGVVAWHRSVGPRRIVSDRRAVSILEVPSRRESL